MRVKVHWNLHKGGYSVTNRKTGLVMPEFADNIVITNPIAKLAQGRYDACHTKSKRHVCAWIIGEMVDPKHVSESTWQQNPHHDLLHYNPFKNRHFTNQYGEEIPFNESLGQFAIFTTDANGKPVTIIKS